VARSVERSYHAGPIHARRFAIKTASVTSHVPSLVVSRKHVGIWIRIPVTRLFNAQKLYRASQSFRYPVVVAESNRRSNAMLRDRLLGARERRSNAMTHVEHEEWL